MSGGVHETCLGVLLIGKVSVGGDKIIVLVLLMIRLIRTSWRTPLE